LIAKRCRLETGEIERTIYQEILPGLPVSSISYHGWSRNPEGEHCWIFLGDAGDVALSKSQGHRVLAARWLANLHVSARGVAAVARLPERGPEHYLKHLRSARDRILHNVSNPALPNRDRESLRALARRLQQVESHWAEVEERCAPLPRTLVHGDFTRKNVRVRDDREVLAMDWEVAGVGIPGPDLLYADTAVWGESITAAWRDVDTPSLSTILKLGHLFRGALAPIDWRSFSLSSRWGVNAMADLRLYHERLAATMQELGWRA
jgi:aminoglycoside phosphotransferase (APT) family kinase protein